MNIDWSFAKCRGIADGKKQKNRRVERSGWLELEVLAFSSGEALVWVLGVEHLPVPDASLAFSMAIALKSE